MTSLHKKYGNLHSRFLDTNGDGTGSIDQVVDGSVTPVDFKITCPEGSTYEINRLILEVQDVGSFDTNAYGNGIALTTGVQVITSRPTRVPIEIDYTAQHPIKTNVDWAAYMYDIDLITFGSGNNVLHARYTLTNDGGPIKLGPGDSLIIRINDDLTGLEEQNIRAGMTVYPARLVP